MKKKNVVTIIVVLIIIAGFIFFLRDKGTLSVISFGQFNTFNINHNNNMIYDDTNHVLTSNVEVIFNDPGCSDENNQAIYVKGIINNEVVYRGQSSISNSGMTNIGISTNKIYKGNIGLWSFDTNTLPSGKYNVCTEVSLGIDSWQPTGYQMIEFGIIGATQQNVCSPTTTTCTGSKCTTIQGTCSIQSVGGLPARYKKSYLDNGMLANFLATKDINGLLSTEYCELKNYAGYYYIRREGDCGKDHETRITNPALYECNVFKKWNSEYIDYAFTQGATDKDCVDIFILKQADIDMIKQSGALRADLQLVLGQVENLSLYIDSLQLTLEGKANIIAALQLDIDTQKGLIQSLAKTQVDQVLMIQTLQTDITQQALLIESLQLTQQQQIEIIKGLNLNIKEQAVMIETLSKNLQDKIAFVDSLQVENSKQAELIAAMKESFSNQALIIDGLDKTVQDDVIIIQNMGLNLQQQGQLIGELQRTNEEKANIIKALTSNLEEQQKIIDGLQLTVQEKQNIIDDLNKSLKSEQSKIIQYQGFLNSWSQLNNELLNLLTIYKYIIIGLIILVVGLIIYIKRK